MPSRNKINNSRNAGLFKGSQNPTGSQKTTNGFRDSARILHETENLRIGFPLRKILDQSIDVVRERVGLQIHHSFRDSQTPSETRNGSGREDFFHISKTETGQLLDRRSQRLQKYRHAIAKRARHAEFGEVHRLRQMRY